MEALFILLDITLRKFIGSSIGGHENSLDRVVGKENLFARRSDFQSKTEFLELCDITFGKF